MIEKRGFYRPVLLLLVITLTLSFAPSTRADYCGDINKDGVISILDVVSLINYKYKGGPPPSPLAIGDVNQSGEIDILDVISIINFKYKDGPPLDCGIIDCASIRGDCLSREIDINRLDPNGYMTLAIEGHDLHIFHMDAYYNCCLEYNVGYTIMGNGINIFEYDTGMPCDCNCNFNLETIIEDLPTGQYYVTLFSIPGDTVGFESIEIGGASGELTDFSSTECLGKSRGSLNYLYSDGILTMQDFNSMWNCVTVFPIIVTFEQAGDTLRFFETPTQRGYVTCVCPVNITATVENIVPWTYTVELYRVYEGMEPILKDRRELILE